MLIDFTGLIIINKVAYRTDEKTSRKNVCSENFFLKKTFSTFIDVTLKTFRPADFFL